MNSFAIAETDTFSKKIKKQEFKQAYHKIMQVVYPQLKDNPFYGPNIKILKGEFYGIYRYRIGKYRLFYTIDAALMVGIVINISHRQDSY